MSKQQLLSIRIAQDGQRLRDNALFSVYDSPSITLIKTINVSRETI